MTNAIQNSTACALFREHTVYCTAHKTPNSLQTLPQSSSIKTLCLAYKNKIRRCTEYEISPLQYGEAAT